jgi:hypothetical protein
MDLFSDNGYKLQCEVLMQSDKAIYNEYSFSRYTNTLSSDEIAISKNLAIKYGLKIGDYIIITYPAFSNEIRVEIVDFIDAVYGISRVYSQNGVVILGYNHVIAENTNIFICFISDEATKGSEHAFFTQNQGRVDVVENTNKLWIAIITSLIIPIIILCIVQFVVCYIFIAEKCASYYKRHLLLGRRISSIKNEVKIDCVMIFLPIALIAFLINTITVRITLGYVLSFSAIYLFIFQFLIFILSCKIISNKIARK